MRLAFLASLLLLVAASSSAEARVERNNRAACREPKAPGLCRGRQLRYAYDEETGNCVSFYYSGCVPTANNFMTYEECRRDCMQKLRY